MTRDQGRFWVGRITYMGGRWKMTRFASILARIGITLSLTGLSIADDAGLLATRNAAHAAGSWYVAPGGIDHPSSCDNSATPCQHIGYVLANVPGFVPGDTISVAAGTYAENITIDKSARIVGAGAAVLDGGGAGRVLTVTSGVAVTLVGLTIRNGLTSGQDGGGIHNQGTLDLQQVEVRENKADAGGNGGGIANGVGGQLTIVSSSIISNTSSALGGGVGGGIQNAGSVVLTDTLLMSNTAASGGGMNNDSLAVLRRVVIDRNFAGAGGGFYNYAGTAQLYETAIVRNRGQNGGGGIENNAALSLINVTLSANIIPGGPGAGLYNNGLAASASLTNVSIISNTINNLSTADGGGIKNEFNGTVTLRNTLLAHNTSSNCGPVITGSIVSNGHNLSSDATCNLSGANDLNDMDSQVGLLQADGGTWTHALLRGSPAIDSANAAACPAVDQRNLPRPQLGGCDIGAYEVVPVDLAATATAVPEPVLASQLLTYTVVVGNNSIMTATNVSMSSALPPGLLFASCTATQGACGGSGSVLSGSLGALASGAQATLTVVVTPTAAGVLTTTFTFAADEPDSFIDNDRVVVSSTVQPLADLAIGSRAIATPVASGSQITFTLFVTNTGPTAASGATVTGSLPAGTSFMSASGEGWACSYADGVMTCMTANTIAIGPAPPITLVVVAQHSPSNTVQVSIRVSSDTIDPVPDNNQTDISASLEKRYFLTLLLVQR
jgi:uncharacterized repeat protein (TIGR01451 family)